MTRVSPHLDAGQITGYVEINPKDAASLNIKEGDSVLLSSKRGRMEASVRLSSARARPSHQAQFFQLPVRRNALRVPASQLIVGIEHGI